jgi:hypothetical protein
MARTGTGQTTTQKTESPVGSDRPETGRSELERLPRTIDGEMLPLREPDERYEFDAFDTSARLLLGGAADLADLLLKLLETWESEIAEQPTATIVEEEEDVGDILRYLLIGLVFTSQRQVRSGTKSVGTWLLGAADTTVSLTRPITNSWIFAPARRVTGVVTSRLEDRLANLVSVGRSEEFVGRLTAETALQESVEWAMDYIAHNPEIRDLVQQQALGFTEEIAVGVRARSISADNVLDGLLRRLLRRPPRSELPGPPAEVEQLEERYNSVERIRPK